MLRRCCLLACLSALAAAPALTPDDLPSAGPVRPGVDDAGFLAALPALQALYAGTATPTSPGPTFRDGGVITLPPGWTMRAYFVSGDAASADAFGVTAIGADIATGVVLFPDAGALRPGDHVDLHGMEIIDGSLFAIGGRGPAAGEVWFGEAALNRDRASHLQFAPGPAGVADLWFAVALDDGVDDGVRWDDLRLAVRFFAAPEPPTVALIVGFAAVIAWRGRARRDRAWSTGVARDTTSGS